MRLLALVPVIALLLPATVQAADDGSAYDSLRTRLKNLEGDRHRGSRRDLWVSLEKQFDRLGKAAGKSQRGCDASFLAAEAAGGLASRSYLRTDREDAADRYRKMASRCPTSHLADDALYRAAEQLKSVDPDGARDDLQKLLGAHSGGDQVSRARKMLATLPKAEVAKEPAHRSPDIEKAKGLASAHPGMPLSVMAGLEVKRVVIDAGHGGNDTGAIGPGGVKEKDVTLAIATKLARKLEASGLQVVMTRDSDRYVELAQRTSLANEKRGDLFVSIHCNAGSSREWRGVETYTLNLNSDRYAARLAARENAGSKKGIGELQYILADLATKANTDDSQHLARAVQSEVVAQVQEDEGKKARDLGLKQALFYVLVGAKMPAVLVETSFISNPEEEKFLASGSHQDDIAASIASGIDRFIVDRQRLARGDAPGGNGMF